MLGMIYLWLVNHMDVMETAIVVLVGTLICVAALKVALGWRRF